MTSLFVRDPPEFPLCVTERNSFHTKGFRALRDPTPSANCEAHPAVRARVLWDVIFRQRVAAFRWLLCCEIAWFVCPLNGVTLGVHIRFARGPPRCHGKELVEV
jgi:hypothetical protein